MQRSLSLGLQTILLRGLGTVPGPVVFGIIIDQVGIRWHGAMELSGPAELNKKG